LDTFDFSYDQTKLYCVKISSLQRNKEKYERSNEKCRVTETIRHEENSIHISYKTGYESDIRKLSREELGVDFEVTVVPEN